MVNNDTGRFYVLVDLRVCCLLKGAMTGRYTRQRPAQLSVGACVSVGIELKMHRMLQGFR